MPTEWTPQTIAAHLSGLAQNMDQQALNNPRQAHLAKQMAAGYELAAAHFASLARQGINPGQTVLFSPLTGNNQ